MSVFRLNQIVPHVMILKDQQTDFIIGNPY